MNGKLLPHIINCYLAMFFEAFARSKQVDAAVCSPYTHLQFARDPFRAVCFCKRKQDHELSHGQYLCGQAR